MRTDEMTTNAIIKTYCKKCNNVDGCFERADNQCLDRLIKLREVAALEAIALHTELIFRQYESVAN